MNLPTPEYGKTDKDTINNLMDTVVKLRKELEYVLYHLDEQNIPMMKSVVGDIKDAFTAIEQNENSITLLAHDLDGAEAQITIQGNQITNLVSTADGHTAQLSIQAGQISQKVSYNGVISAINQSAESISIDAQRINLNGVTTMSGLAYVGNDLTLGSLSYPGTINFQQFGSTVIRLQSNGGYLNINGYGLNVDGSINADSIYSGYGNFSDLQINGQDVAIINDITYYAASKVHYHSEYAQNMGGQNIRLQHYGGGLEVWDGSSYLGKATLV